MIRLFILGSLSIIGLIITIVTVVSVFALIKWIKQLLTSGRGYVDQQHQNWKTRQAEKDVPDFLREASKRMTHIDQLTEQLTPKWKLLANPLIKEAHEMLQMGMANPKQAELTRNYYTITLKALEGFTEALVDMNGVMQETEEEKARQNIEVLMNDTYKYRAKLESKKRFDFHVMMEVIKQRFGK